MQSPRFITLYEHKVCALPSLDSSMFVCLRDHLGLMHSMWPSMELLACRC